MQCSTVGPYLTAGPRPMPGPRSESPGPVPDRFQTTSRPESLALPDPRLLRQDQVPPLPQPLHEAPTPSATGAVAKPPPGPREREALDKEKAQQDRLAAEEIYARMRAQRELAQARMAALIADVQTEIHRLWQEVMINRRKVHDDILKAWHKVLLG